MLKCEKCGANLEEGMKFCDKCGSEIVSDAPAAAPDNNIENTYVAEPTDSAYNFENVSESEVVEDTKKSKVGIVGFFEKYLSYIPHPFTKPGDRTALIAGLGSLGVLAILYIVCFFAFMSEMCLPIALGSFSSDYTGGLGNLVSGASPLWMIFYFIFCLFPVAFAVLAFLNKKLRLYSIFVSAFIFVLTLFSFIAWLICEPSSYMEAVSMYTSAGSIAWYVFVDALSEIWYLKMILSLAAVFGFGVDYLVNKGK